MKLFLGLILVVYMEARIINEKCDGVIVHNINHEKEVLKGDLDSPYQLAIDYDTNILFFSYTSHDTDDVFKSAYYNLKTHEFGNITGISGGFASAVDSKSHTVYLGGRDGVYQFDFETKKAKHLGAIEHNIWQMFVKDDVSYTTYPAEEVYSYNKGYPKRLEELNSTAALLVAFDNNHNIYFSNSSGLFSYKKSKSKIVKLGEYNLNGFASDINGNLYFSTPFGIYFINENQTTIDRIASIENVYGVAIESDNNIIYASETDIIRLKPTKSRCYVEEIKNL